MCTEGGEVSRRWTSDRSFMLTAVAIFFANAVRCILLISYIRLKVYKSMWRQFTFFALIGLGSSITSIVATILLAFVFSLFLMAAVVMAVAGANTEIISTVLEILVLPLAGALAGLSGGLMGGAVMRRLWDISFRWLFGWATTWLLGGIGIWLSIWGWHDSMTTTEMLFSSSGMWMLFGIVCSFVFSVLFAPWKHKKTGEQT
ncbi:MAG: hypothetical protein AB1509_09750 [Chloroflexota bacterium]